MRSVLPVLAAAIIATPLQAAVITFDEFTNPGQFITSTEPVTSGGFLFDAASGFNEAFLFWGGASGYSADATGATLTHNYGAPVTVTKVGGGTFDLVSLDLAHAYNEAAAGSITFTFTDALGSSTDVFNFDALLTGLQTYTVNRAGLLSFSYDTSLAGGGYPTAQIDNVVVDQLGAVPEPATWAMLMLGFGLVGAAARRRTPVLA